MTAKSIPVVLLIAAGSLAGAVRPVAAQLRVCNQSAETVSIAIAYRDQLPSGPVVSRGWYVVKPDECPVLVGGDLQNRYFYVRAEGSNRSVWDGDYAYCVVETAFRQNGGDCAPGERRGFFVIDTGARTSWTQTLTGAVPSRDRRIHDAILGLRVSWRTSLLDDSAVMRLHNAQALAFGLTLKCSSPMGFSKTLEIAVPPSGIAEVGFVQGWPGNFIAGESCRAYDGNEFVWRVDAPGH
jgi:uncharacterized membrane protein